MKVVASFAARREAESVGAALRAQGFRSVLRFDDAEHRCELIVDEPNVPKLVEDFIVREGGAITSPSERSGTR